MSDPRMGIMRAALERIADVATRNALDTRKHDVEIASEALAEVDALPENDTEAGDHYEVHYEHLLKRARAADARLAQIAELLGTQHDIRDKRDTSVSAKAYRIARGEEPA